MAGLNHGNSYRRASIKKRGGCVLHAQYRKMARKNKKEWSNFNDVTTR